MLRTISSKRRVKFGNGVTALITLLSSAAFACSASENGTPDMGTGGASQAHGGSSTSTGGALGNGGVSNQNGGAQSGGAANGGNASAGASTGGASTAHGGASNESGGSAGNGSGGSGGAKAQGGTSNGTGGKAAGSGGMTASSGGSGGSAGSGSTGSPSVCKFASGLNIAWVNFANDVPNPNIATFNTIFKNSHDAGGNIIRWWFHTNGSTTPGYDSNGLSKKLQQSHIDGVKAILSAAQSNGVRITLSLWSFDMLQSNAGDAYTNNKLLLENDTNRQAYIDNYLTPLVNAIKGHPGLYAWEIFNEPEGMGPKGWATYRTTEAAIQKTVNWFAAAIHTADPTALVTNGSQTFDYCSNVSGKSNLYSDSALRAAGGKQNGILDFYEVHYYTVNGASNSPFTKSASSWGLDKKLVMGEFSAEKTDGVEANALYTNLYTSGYNGAWAWSYNADQKWPTMQAPMQALSTAHTDVATCGQ